MPDETPLYEAMYILDVTIAEEEQQQAVAAVENAITEHGGEVERTLIFGQRRFAYAIANHVEGLYMITYFRRPGLVVRLLNQEFSLIEPGIRSMVVTANPKAIFAEPEPAAEDAEEATDLEPEAEETDAEETDAEETDAEEDTDSPEAEPSE